MSIYPLFLPFYAKSFCQSILKIWVGTEKIDPTYGGVRFAKGKRAKEGLGILGGNNPKTVGEAAVIKEVTRRRTTIPRISVPRAAA